MTRRAVVTGIEMTDNPNRRDHVGLILRILPDDGQPTVKEQQFSDIKVSGFTPGQGPLRFGGENCTAVEISESVRIIDARETVIDLTKLPPETKYLRIWT